MVPKITQLSELSIYLIFTIQTPSFVMLIVKVATLEEFGISLVMNLENGFRVGMFLSVVLT